MLSFIFWMSEVEWRGLTGFRLAWHGAVQTSGEGYFVLKSSSMQMTVAEGRITSLFDIHHM